jgi:hypothetical protein
MINTCGGSGEDEGKFLFPTVEIFTYLRSSPSHPYALAITVKASL